MKRRSEISVAGIIKSAVTDTAQANASFQSSSGITAKIIRKAHAGCCAACAAAAGEWYYGEQPEDTFRRHNGCTCTVAYDPGNGKYKNVHKSQAWNESQEAIEWRKQFSREQKKRQQRSECIIYDRRKYGFFRNEATISDVLEEMFHARQDRKKHFGEELTAEVICRREIEAQEYLIQNAEKYKIPEKETTATLRALEEYKRQLSKLLRSTFDE